MTPNSYQTRRSLALNVLEFIRDVCIGIRQQKLVILALEERSQSSCQSMLLPTMQSANLKLIEQLTAASPRLLLRTEHVILLLLLIRDVSCKLTNLYVLVTPTVATVC